MVYKEKFQKMYDEGRLDKKTYEELMILADRQDKFLERHPYLYSRIKN
jgi:hypothetical protein